MALTPFTGELDTAPDMSPFSGELDPEPSGMLRRGIADPALSLLKGAIRLPEAAVGIADMATGGEAGKAAEGLGFQPQKAREIIDTWQSPELQQAKAAVSQAKGFIPTVAAMVQNPSTIVDSALESAPSMIGGAGVARGLLKYAPNAVKAASTAIGVTEGTLAAGAGEGVVAAGATAEAVRQESPTKLLDPRQIALSAATGALTGMLGIAGGAVASKLGIGDIDTLLAGGKGPGYNKNIIRRVAEGAFSEGLLEELPQSAQEQVAQNLALGKPWNEGVAESAASGMIVGGMMGLSANIRPSADPSSATKAKILAALAEAANPATDTTISDALDAVAQQDAARVADKVTPEVVEQAIQDDVLAEALNLAPATPLAPAPQEPTTASVPFMITRDMRSRLQDMGYDDAGIDRMKPADAQEILRDEAPPLTPLDSEAPPLVPELTSPEVNPIKAWMGTLPAKERAKLVKRATDQGSKAQDYLLRKYNEANPASETLAPETLAPEPATPPKSKTSHTPPPAGKYRQATLLRSEEGRPQVVALERPDGKVGFVTPKGEVLATASVGTRGLSVDVEQGADLAEVQGYLDAYKAAIAGGTAEEFTPSKGYQNVASQFGEEISDVNSLPGENSGILPRENSAGAESFPGELGTAQRGGETDEIIKTRVVAEAKKFGKILDPSKLSFTETEASAHLDAIGAIFGHKVRTFEYMGDVDVMPQGFVFNDDTTIYINGKHKDLQMTLLGHEMAHQMESEAPGLYEELRGHVRARADMQSYAKYAERLRKIPEYSKLSDAALSYEAVANLVGAQFNKRSFWDTLAAKEPSLFAKLISWVKGFITKTRSAFSIFKDSETIVKDVKGIEQVVADIFAKYARLHKEGKFGKGIKFATEGVNNENGNLTAGILAGASKQGKESSLRAASDELERLVSSVIYDGRVTSPRARKVKEASVLRAWAKSQGILNDGKAFDKTWNEQRNSDGKRIKGNEHDVVFNGDGTVTKRNHVPGTYHVSYRELFDRVELFNYLFGTDSALTLTGFQDTEGGLLPEFSQRVMSGPAARIEQTEKMLTDAGFKRIEGLTAYQIPGTDIILTDVFGENTRQVGDVTVPMDYVIFHGDRARAWLKEQTKGSKVPSFDQAEFDKAFDDAGIKFAASISEGKDPVNDAAAWFKGPQTTPLTDTPAFKKWFGKSKVVDANGEPLVVYHGTYADFNAFNTAFTVGQMGFHFGTQDAVDEIIDRNDFNGAEGIPRVIESYLRLENPLRLNDLGAWQGTDVVAMVNEALGTKIHSSASDRAIKAAIQKAGYDGVVYKNEFEDAEGGADSFIAFSPIQIKSATGNNGDFDGENPDIRFAAADRLRASTKGSGNMLRNVRDKVMRFIMPISRTIDMAVSSRQFAPIHKYLKQYGDLVQRKAGYKQSELDRAWYGVVAIGKAFKTKAEEQMLSDLVIMATTYQLHADPTRANDWTEESWAKSGMQERTGKTLGVALKEVRDLYAKFTPEQRVAHQTMIDQMHEVYLEGHKAALAPWEAVHGAEMMSQARKAKEGDSEELLNLKQIIENIDARYPLLKGDYFPFMRFGDFMVRTASMDENGEMGSTQRMEFFDSELEASEYVDMINANPDNGLHATIEKQQKMGRDAVNIPGALISKLRSAAEAQFKKTNPGASQEDADKYAKAIEGLMQEAEALRINMMPGNATAGNKLHRQGVAGFSTNVLKVYSNYVQNHANANAGLIFGAQIEQSFRDMHNAIKAFTSEPQYDIRSAVEMDTLYNYLYENDKTSAKVKINGFVKATGKTSFLWYLSSPSIWAVQWSQPFMITIPKMAAKFGYGKAFKAYTQAAKQYLAGDFSDEKINTFNREHEFVGDRIYDLITESYAEGADKAKIDKQIAALFSGFKNQKDRRLVLLKVLSLQGRIDLSSSHSLRELGEASNSGDRLADKLSATSNWAAEKLSFFMRHSETGSRRAAAVSAFELSHGKSFLDANEYAAHIINDTLYDVSSENRGKAWQGNAGHILGQFQYFRLHTLGKILQLVKDSYGAEYKNNQTPEGKAKRDEARKEMAYMVGTSMALAGAGGTPLALALGNTGMTAIWGALSFMFGDDDDPEFDMKRSYETTMREYMGDTIGNVFIKGLPSLVGWDVSQRIGLGSMGDIVMGEPPAGVTGTAKANWYAGRLLGPSWGIASDIVRSGDALAEGEIGKAIQYSTPKVLRDFLKAAEVSSDGVRGGGKTILASEDISMYSYALMMVGINPMEVSLAREESRYIKNLSTELSRKRSLLIRKVAEATADNDVDARDAALEGINKWTAANPKLGITAEELARGIKRVRASRTGGLTERERIVKEM